VADTARAREPVGPTGFEPERARTEIQGKESPIGSPAVAQQTSGKLQPSQRQGIFAINREARHIVATRNASHRPHRAAL